MKGGDAVCESRQEIISPAQGSRRRLLGTVQTVEYGDCTMCNNTTPLSPFQYFQGIILYFGGVDNPSMTGFRTCGHPRAEVAGVTKYKCHTISNANHWKYRQWDKTGEKLEYTEDSSSAEETENELAAEQESADTCVAPTAGDLNLEAPIANQYEYYDVNSDLPYVLRTRLGVKTETRDKPIFVLPWSFDVLECDGAVSYILVDLETFMRQRVCQIEEIALGNCVLCSMENKKKTSHIFSHEGVKVNDASCAGVVYGQGTTTQSECESHAVSGYYAWAPNNSTRTQNPGRDCFDIKFDFNNNPCSSALNASSNTTNSLFSNVSNASVANDTTIVCEPERHNVNVTVTSTSSSSISIVQQLLFQWKRRPGEMYDSINNLHNGSGSGTTNVRTKQWIGGALSVLPPSEKYDTFSNRGQWTYTNMLSPHHHNPRNKFRCIEGVSKIGLLPFPASAPIFMVRVTFQIYFFS